MVESQVTLSDVQDAASVLKGVARVTPLERSRTLGEMAGTDLHLKLENRQRTGSFKLRGAYYKIWSLSDGERKRGVVAASAGNHAQGVALAATLLQTSSTIVMPESASPAKVDATKGYGAKVVLFGNSFDETLAMAKKISLREGATFIHPFDDPKVIAGQGTVGLEVLDAQSDLGVVVVPIGGGGLISGMATCVKAIRPKVRIIGVQAQAYPGMHMAFHTGKLVSFKTQKTIADGIAVRQPGKLTYNVVKRLVDDIVLVSDSDIAKAIFLLLERMKLVAEPAGAASVAACLAGRVKTSGETSAAVVSGGNVDMPVLDQIVSKGLEREHRLLRIRATLPDRPGALRDLLDVVAKSRSNVIAVDTDRLGVDIPIGMAVVTLLLETENAEHTRTLVTALGRARFKYKTIR